MKHHRTLCRHCCKTRANRPKGLCWVCYYTPGLRERYDPVSSYGRRSKVPDFLRAAPLPRPTTALPGSAEKIAVLADRARKGLALHHPRDAGWTGQGAVPLVSQLLALKVDEDDDE